jgi:carbamoyl-phosphate synthase small subunit
MLDTDIFAPDQKPTAILVLDDGQIFKGYGFGAETENIGEICFNTGLTGYEETLSDPSYAGQIINFTFPHIGNVGANEEDTETSKPFSLGLITRQKPTDSSNWRSEESLDEWLKKHNLPGIYGIDTRALTRHIRDNGAPRGVICHRQDGEFDVDALTAKAKNWSGLNGLDLAQEVTCKATYEWDKSLWAMNDAARTAANSDAPHIVAIDFGAKHNILRCLVNSGARVSVVPATTSLEDILALQPAGVFLSNGPGDPAATGKYAVPVIQGLMDKKIPLFGICLGHQLLALAIGGKTEKMHLGHRGANHPVKDLITGKVEITSQNHGFQVLADSLPANAKATHVSLFDGSNEGIAVQGVPAFSVQYHPEASPGPHDSHYLFERFMDMVKLAA